MNKIRAKTPTQDIAYRAMQFAIERLQAEEGPVPVNDLMALTEAVAKEGNHWSWLSAWQLVRQWAAKHPNIKIVGKRKAALFEWVRKEVQGSQLSSP